MYCYVKLVMMQIEYLLNHLEKTCNTKLNFVKNKSYTV